MIINQIAETYYVYVSDRINMIKSVLTHFGLVSSTGDVFKFVQIQQNGNYFPKGGNVTLPATVVLAKDKVIFVLNDSYSFSAHKSNSSSLVAGLNHFGSQCLVDFGGININTPFVVKDTHHMSGGGKKIIIGNYLKDNSKKADEFVQRIRTDSGRMIYPLTRKYHDLAHLMGNKRGKLTGYVDLNTYLKLMRQPSMVVNSDIDDCDYVFNIADEQSQCTVKVVGSDKGKLILSFSSRAKLISASTPALHPAPYLIFTLKPFSILNQKMPFFITPIKDYRIFVSVLVLDNTALLKSLSGGVNLLK